MTSRKKVRIMSVIKPTRAYYLCDKKKECSSGWSCQNGQCKHTEDVKHALNGPVVNVREWDTRFTLEEHDGLLYYVEKEGKNDRK